MRAPRPPGNACGIYYRNNKRMKVADRSSPAVARSKPVQRSPRDAAEGKEGKGSKEGKEGKELRSPKPSRAARNRDRDADDSAPPSDADADPPVRESLHRGAKRKRQPSPAPEEEGEAKDSGTEVDPEPAQLPAGGPAGQLPTPSPTSATFASAQADGTDAADGVEAADEGMADAEAFAAIPEDADTRARAQEAAEETKEPEEKDARMSELAEAEPAGDADADEASAVAVGEEEDAAADGDREGSPAAEKKTASPKPGSGKSGNRCAHCNVAKSPCWRRQANGNMLCNACGLYYRYHNAMRPIPRQTGAEDDDERAKPKKAPSSPAQKKKPAKRADDEHHLPLRRPNAGRGASEPRSDDEGGAALSGALNDPDMDPATAALIASLMSDAPLTEKVKMGRRKDTSAAGKSFAIFGEEPRSRSRKPKPPKQEQQAEGGMDTPPETPVDVSTSSTSSSIGASAGQPRPAESRLARDSAPPAPPRGPIIYVPPAASNSEGAHTRKRRRWDMVPEKYIEGQLQGVLRSLEASDLAAAAKAASLLAEYCMNESLFHFGACFLRLEAVALRDRAKLESAEGFATFAERKEKVPEDWVLKPGRKGLDLESGAADVARFVRELAAWMGRA
ncbi:hypothetical protein DFJ74DRAFT_685344 [Hyaloraphidium curvatum]|nr:hypothetical protein DFJ74DRAFT_685344 [Hyaloraphidium curvatum]